MPKSWSTMVKFLETGEADFNNNLTTTKRIFNFIKTLI